MFDLYENVVYPGQGVAKISSIIEKEIGGSKARFYELSFISKDVTVLVPVANADPIGIRRISDKKDIATIFTILAKPARRLHHYEFTASSWNKRKKEYHTKLHNGTIQDLSEMYRDLKFVGTQKALSFGEKNLLSQAESLLAEEISLVQNVDEKDALHDLRGAYEVSEEKHTKSP